MDVLPKKMTEIFVAAEQHRGTSLIEVLQNCVIFNDEVFANITDKELIETIEYGDYGMMRALDTLRNFTFELDLKDNNFIQITQDAEGNRTFPENYKRID